MRLFEFGSAWTGGDYFLAVGLPRGLHEWVESRRIWDCSQAPTLFFLR
jgi:hypothetical protein